MKKFLSLMLLACMLLSATALADFGYVVQDEQPPMLVSVTNAEGKVVAAYLYSAKGELIAELEADGNVILTDVHFRAEAQEDVSARLTASYEGVMDKVHHSDVACALHEHDVKVDINQVLGAIDQDDLDAHDLIMYELYDVCFTENVEMLLVDDAAVSVTFELAAHQPMPLIVLFTANGADWTVMPFTVNGKQFTVSLPASGTLALLADGHQVMGIGEEVDPVFTTDEADEETSGNFTPSVSGKPAPELEIITGEDGEEYVGEIKDNEGTESILVPNRNYVVVTAPIEKACNIDIQTYEHLSWAYGTVLNAADVSELPADCHEGTIAEHLAQRLEELQLPLTAKDLVVKDLFEITAYGDYVHYLYNENYYLEVTFKTDLDADKAVIVLHSADSVHWHLHPVEECIVHEDGRITLKLYDMGTVAILVETDAVIDVQDAVLSPN